MNKHYLFLFCAIILTFADIIAQDSTSIQKLKIQIDANKNEVSRQIFDLERKQETRIKELEDKIDRLKSDIDFWSRMLGLGGMAGIVALAFAVIKLYRDAIAKGKTYANEKIQTVIDENIEQHLLELLKSGKLKKFVKSNEEALKKVINLHKLEQDVLNKYDILSISANQTNADEFEQVMNRFDIPVSNKVIDLELFGSDGNKQADILTESAWKKQLQQHKAIIINNRGNNPLGNPANKEGSLYKILRSIPSDMKIMIVGSGRIDSQEFPLQRWHTMSFANLDAQIKGNLLRLLLIEN